MKIAQRAIATGLGVTVAVCCLWADAARADESESDRSFDSTAVVTADALPDALPADTTDLTPAIAPASTAAAGSTGTDQPPAIAPDSNQPTPTAATSVATPVATSTDAAITEQSSPVAQNPFELVPEVPPTPEAGTPGDPEAGTPGDNVPNQPSTLGDRPAASTEADELVIQKLETNPNPLQFPTLPDEVKILLTQPITLEQAVEIGRRNNRDLRQLYLAIERSRAQLRQSIAANYPQLRLSSSITNSLSASSRLNLLIQNRAARDIGNFRGQVDIDTQDQVVWNNALELTYNIYTAGLRPANIDAAQAQLRSDELALEATFEDLRRDITDGYYRLQQENEQFKIDQSAVKFREQSVKDAQSLEKAGLGTRFEVLQAEVELANDRQLVVQTRDRQTQRRRELARLLSLPEAIDIQTADTIAKAGDWTLPLETSIVLAYRNRAEIEQQLAQRELNLAQRRARLSQLGPQVSAFARYELLDVVQPSDNFDLVSGYSTGLQMQWTIFDGGAARAQARQELIAAQISENGVGRARDRIRFEVEVAYSNLMANAENIQTSLKAIESAQEEVRLARLRFQAGVGTQTDRLNAENRLTRARGNVLIAIIGYNRALAALERAVSNLPPGTVKPVTTPIQLPDLGDQPAAGSLTDLTPRSPQPR
ncbi:MAG: TolC family protein [Oscillatoriales cyanobacterium]|nr:MAG: TolC family protein [Oscillatoriales cyanobacterium]